MKAESADGQNESADALWPSVLKISSDEFEQSVAVAQLAVKLWEDKIFGNAPPLEKQKEKDSGPVKYLREAWKLIESARERVLRPQTHAEYLAVHGESHEAAEMVLARILQNSHVPFKKLCDRSRHKGDMETIKGVPWKVFTTERGFDELFWAYWRDIGEKWKAGDQEIGTLTEVNTEGKPRKVNLYSKSERNKLAHLASDRMKWKARGQQLLDPWKRDGVEANDFLALARFRKERDNRAENLK